MQYKALISFSGLISMSMGEVREIADQKIVNDLLKAGYIQPNPSKMVQTAPSALMSEASSRQTTNQLISSRAPADRRSVRPAARAGQSRLCLAEAKRSKKEEVKKTRKGGKKKSEN